MEWSTIDCLNLIAAYQQHPVLWNPLHSMYSDKEKKQDAWTTIGRLFGCPTSDVRKKIDSLLRSYRREKTKARKTFLNENGSHEVYVSNWYAYNRMSFLDGKVETRNLQSSTDISSDYYYYDDPPQTKEENEQERLTEALWSVEAVYEPEPAIPDEPDLVQGLGRHVEPVNGKKIVGQWNTLKLVKEPGNKCPSKSSAKRSLNLDDRMTSETRNTFKATDSKNHSNMDSQAVYGQHVGNKHDHHSVCDQHDGNKDYHSIYGQYVGNKLKSYDKRTKAIVEYHINNILFQADMGHFESRIFDRSHKFNTFR